MTDYVGRTLGPYKLEMALGKGGMATVYRAYQSSVKRYVAIKVMAPEIANQPGFVERFEREAEVIAALEHPHILPIIDYGESDGIHYLVMRYIEGGSLDDRMRRKPLSLKECSRLLEQMTSALDYAHRRGVIHRDLKPNNVLLDANENAYLTDFGIARLTQSEHKLTATGSIMGTPAYMSPEQGMGRPVDARSDIYTLGVVLYEMVLNRLPFSGDTPAALIFQHVYEQPTPPKQIKPDLPDAIVAVLNRAMAKNPDDRYQSASDMAEAFTEAVATRSTAQRITPPLGEEGTIVGGPMQSVPVGTPVKPITAAASGFSQVASPAIPAGPTVSGSGTGVAESRKGIPVTLIVAALVVIVLLLGSGFLFINNTNTQNANQTGTAVGLANLASTSTANADATETAIANGTSTAGANQTGTGVAILALSATKTPTNTPLATNTSSSTPTSTPTATPNATLTALANQMSTVNAFQAGATTTAAANIANTANAQTAIAGTRIVQATQTRQSQIDATSEMQRRLTVTAQYRDIGATASLEAANATATAKAASPIPSKTLTPRPSSTRTRVPPTTPPTVKGYNGPPDAVIAKLQKDGVLPAVTGSIALQKDGSDVIVDKADFTRWDTINTNVKLTDFVLSAEVQWTAPDEPNGCGFILRHTKTTDNKLTFYSLTITRAGRYIAYAYDEDTWREQPLTSQTSSLIETDDGATNHLLLIARGSQFQLFINGQLAGTFSDKSYTSGNIGVLGSRGADSTELTCEFRNIWAYSIKAQDTSTAGMTSNDPQQVIGALTKAGIVTGNPRLVVQEPSAEITLEEASKFKVSDPITQTTFTNFVLSTDITSTAAPADTEKLDCGVFYNNTDGIANLIVVFYNQRQGYSMWMRQDKTWADSAVKTGTSTAIKTEKGTANRFILVVVDNKATVFINGTKVFEATEASLAPGMLGYYIGTGKTTEPQTCSFNNTMVWRLN